MLASKLYSSLRSKLIYIPNQVDKYSYISKSLSNVQVLISNSFIFNLNNTSQVMSSRNFIILTGFNKYHNFDQKVSNRFRNNLSESFKCHKINVSQRMFSSTVKKRRMKMNKHKLKKRRKALRMNTKISRS
jgi:hypothetical protein